MTHNDCSGFVGLRASRWQGRQTIMDQEPRRRAGAQAPHAISDNKGTTT
jgi:hypothetical protein